MDAVEWGVMDIGIIGDVHGNSAVLKVALMALHKAGVTTAVQVGDFGFWPGKRGQEYLKNVRALTEAYGITLYVVPGNHEDYDYLNGLIPNADGILPVQRDLYVIPRGFTWTWDETRFCALGGAPSIDRTWRIKRMMHERYPLWWPEEFITPEDVERTIATGPCDVLLTHDAPRGIPHIERHIQGNPHGFPLEDVAYADMGRDVLVPVVEALRPVALVHGHYHIPYVDTYAHSDGYATTCYGMGADAMPGSYGILDTTTCTIRNTEGETRRYWKVDG